MNLLVSIVVISVAFAALPLAILSISGLQSNKRAILGITQKFILVVVLFTIFIATTYLLNLPPYKYLDISKPVWTTVTGWVLAISFLIDASTFFGSVALFIIGTFDLIVTFANLRISPTGGQESPNIPTNPVTPDQIQVNPVQVDPINPRTNHSKSQIVPTSRPKPNYSVKPLIWGICLGGVVLSVFFGILCALVWPKTQGWSISLGIELGGLAISFPLIYLLVDKSVKIERRKRWGKVRGIVIRWVRMHTVELLFHFDFKFSQRSILEFANNDSIIQEATQLSRATLVKDWSINDNQIIQLVSKLEKAVEDLEQIIVHYSFVLEEEPNLFEKILDAKDKTLALSAISSIRSIAETGRNFNLQEQNDTINQSFSQLLLAAVAIIEELNRL